MNSVYVAIRHHNYEGYSEPVRAFSTQKDAELYRAGAADNYGNEMHIFEMPVDNMSENPRKVE